MVKKSLWVKLLVAVFATLWISPAFAQLSKGGMPPSFAPKNMAAIRAIRKPVVRKLSVPFDTKQLEEEDKLNAEFGRPPRVAQIIDVSYTMENSGVWTTLETGERVWRLGINAPNAVALSLYYDHFYLPKGSKLFVYSANGAHVIGAYTSENNPQYGTEFATEIVAGDEVILEYVAPATVDTAAQLGAAAGVREGNALEPVISVSGVGYIYNTTVISVASEFYNTGDLHGPGHVGRSGDCMINVNCPMGVAWQNQKKGVAAVIQKIGNGSYLCSGTIINNTAKDLLPYFLMAFHCNVDNSNRFASEADLRQWMFYFHFEHTGCDNSTPIASFETATGALRLSYNSIVNGGDGLLLRLIDIIPPSWDVYYNGWDRRNATTPNGVGIHHPAGDAKKISSYTDAISATWTGASSGAHWRVSWDKETGVTQGGSSGSPMFDENGRVVGTLTGGNGGDNACLSVGALYGYYGKMWYHWDQAPDPAQRMSKYLDPLNTGEQFIDGMYAADTVGVNFLSSSSSIYASESVTYVDASVYAGTWRWSFEGGSITSYVGKYPPIVTYDNTGTYTTTLTINEGTVHERTMSKQITVTQKDIIVQVVGSTIGTSTSSIPLGSGGSSRNPMGKLYTATLYSKDELQWIDGDITSIAWHCGTAVSAKRSLRVYLKHVAPGVTQLPSSANYSYAKNGAKQVFENSNFSNLTDYQELAFNMNGGKFSYKRDSSLLVVVETIFDKDSVYNPATTFTSVLNSTLHWTTNYSGIINNSTPSSGLYSMRPNLRITSKTTPIPPQADFVAANVTYNEGFDADQFPPSGWSIENRGTSANVWKHGNVNAYSFNRVDPKSKYSVYVAYDTARVVDTWIISTAVPIPEAKTQIDFYTLFFGQYLAGGSLKFYVSTNNGVTWTEKWTSGNIDIPAMNMSWRKQTVNLGEYVGQSVKFAWQYQGAQGKIGSYAALDDIKIYSLRDNVEIYQGESVTFIDRSVGPPITWRWNFDGGNIESSSSTSPTVTYLQEGTYPVSLTVASNLGSNTKSVSNAVVVKVKKPISGVATYADAFLTGGKGHNTTHGGQLLPPEGGRVNFEDISGNYPTSWKWSFPGATPASSTSKAPQGVLYPAGVNSYDVIHQVANNAGPVLDTLKKAVQVGGTASVWNVYASENPASYYNARTPITPEYVTGVGAPFSLGEATSERFDFQGIGVISKVGISSVGLYMSSVGVQHMKFKVKICEDAYGIPGAAIDSMVSPSLASDAGGEMVLDLPRPVPVQGTFHVVVSKDSGAGTRVITQTPLRTTYRRNTICTYRAGRWIDISKLLNAFYASSSVSVEYTFTSFKMQSDSLFKEKSVQVTPETISFTSSYNTWSATTNDAWINLSAAGGAVTGGAGSLTFTCTDNLTPETRVGKIRLVSGGGVVNIEVRQAGNAPGALTAEYDDINRAINLSWIDMSVDMADSVELHSAFTPNSAGTIGWNYIDGDRGTTKNIAFSGAPMAGNCIVPDGGKKMAYTIFDPNATSPALLSTSPAYAVLKGHRGKKSFAFLVVDTASTTKRRNDDWLVTPKLYYMSNFTFSFWAKSVDPANLESLRVAYSTGGKAEADFTHVLATVSAVPATWTKYSYTIPASATYVAINYISKNKFILLVDDIFMGTGTAPAQMSISRPTGKAMAIAATAEPAGAAVASTQNTSLYSSLLRVDKVQLSASELSNGLNDQNATQSVGDEVVLRWDNGTNNNAIGLAIDDYVIEVGVRFTPADLWRHSTDTITAVEIFPVNKGKKMTLNIRSGNEIIYSQALGGLVAGAFNRIELEEKVPVDASKDLIVGYSYKQVNGLKVAGCDVGPAKAGKGDLISVNGEPLSSLVSMESALNFNWNIAVILTEGVAPTKYNVYRSGRRIASMLSTKTFTDTTMPQATNVCYTVTSVYDNDTLLESAPSNLACIYAKGLIYIAANDNARTEIELDPKFTGRIARGNLVNGDTEAGILSKVKYQPPNPLSPAGQYGIVPILDSLRASSYAPSYGFVAVNGTLTITAIPTKIRTQPKGSNICYGGSYTMDIVADGVGINYQWQRLEGSKWVDAGAAVATSGLTNLPGSHTFTNATAKEAGYYRILVNARSDKKISDTVAFRVGIPQPEIVGMQWGNTPSINCNVETNGGHDFKLFQWFKNGTKIEGATKPYIKVPTPTTDSYHCEMDTKENIPLMLCQFSPSAAPEQFMAYPSPVERGGRVYLKTMGMPEGSTLSIYNLNGVLVKAGIVLFGNSNSVELDNIAPGAYVLHAVSPDGSKQTTKLVVN